MTVKALLHFIDDLAKINKWVFTFNHAKIYFQEDEETLRKSLAEHVESTLIMQLTDNLYVNYRSRERALHPRESLLFYLRPYNFTYISLEDILSQWGVISQICTVVTCMTTGEEGFVITRIGCIEFTHFDRSENDDVLDGIYFNAENNCWEASPTRAYADFLKYRKEPLFFSLDLDELDDAIKTYESWPKE